LYIICEKRHGGNLVIKRKICYKDFTCSPWFHRCKIVFNVRNILLSLHSRHARLKLRNLSFFSLTRTNPKLKNLSLFLSHTESESLNPHRSSPKSTFLSCFSQSSPNLSLSFTKFNNNDNEIRESLNISCFRFVRLLLAYSTTTRFVFIWYAETLGELLLDCGVDSFENKGESVNVLNFNDFNLF
jgi:hypothetical protein